MSILVHLHVPLAILPLLILLTPLSLVPTAAAASSGPMVDAAMVQVIQGQLDTTMTKDAYNDFHALKIITYQVVPGDTRVWTSVPTDARDLLVWTPLGQAAAGSYGWETGGQMADSFFVTIPSSFNYSSGKFLVHVSYSWTQDFSHGKATIDVSEPNPFLSNGTYVLMTYVLKGYNVTGGGLEFTFDQTGSMSQYPDKDLYINVTKPYDSSVARSMTISKPKANIPWALYLGAAAIGGALLLAFAYARYARPAAKGSSRPSGDESRMHSAAAKAVPESVHRRELVDRKKEILTEIEVIKDGLSSGTTPRADAEKELVRLRKEYKSTRNELNRLARNARPAQAAHAPFASDLRRSDEFELVLASLAKIDEDYEKGRLPKGSYQSLRKDYLEKASKLMAEGDGQLESVDPAEAEKVKLMEAIIGLDEEHGRGEIEAKVYEDLRASYKNELAVLMNREGEQD